MTKKSEILNELALKTIKYKSCCKRGEDSWLIFCLLTLVTSLIPKVAIDFPTVA